MTLLMRLSSSFVSTAGSVGAWIVLLSATVPTQDTLPGLLNVGAEHYVEGVYDSPASGRTRLVFYRGETIQAAVRLLNTSPIDILRVVLPMDPFEIRWVQSPGNTRQPRIDGTPFIEHAALGSVAPVNLNSPVEIPGRTAVVMPFEIPTAGLPAGTYELSVRPLGWATSRRISIDYQLSFELRAPDSLPSLLDLHYRRAVEHLLTNAFQQADAEADIMLQLYPQASMAYALKAEVARRLGRQGDSARAQATARRLKDSGSDQLALRNRTPSIQ